MYLPSSGARIEANPSCQIRAASSLEASSNRLALRIATEGSKSRDPQPHALDLGGDPVSLLGLDHVVVDVLVVGDAGDRDVHRDRLRRREVVVRLDLGRLP